MHAAEHAAARDALVARIHNALCADERFGAAWLSGSLGRGDADAWSDVDLWLAVVDHACAELCQRPDGLAPTLSPSRAALVTLFGEIAVGAENALNAGPDGVAMNIVYRDSLVVVDWYLVPAASAARPAATRLLFDHFGVPSAEMEPTALSDRARLAAVEVAIFWYFVQPAVRAIRRGDAVQFEILLQRMRNCTWKAGRMVEGAPAGYFRERGRPLARSEGEQIELLRRACAQMLVVMRQVEAIGGVLPRDPMTWVERLLA